MTAEATAISIPVESALLTGKLLIPAAARGLIILADAGPNDSCAAGHGISEAALQLRGYGTLAVSLLTPEEAKGERSSGCHHLDVRFLADRVCLVLGSVRHQAESRSLPLGILAQGMAAAGAIVSASRHADVRAVVCWNGRADLAGEAIEAVSAPTLLLATRHDTHMLDLNRKTAALLRTPHALVALEIDPGLVSGRLIADHAADWFDRFLDDERRATRTEEEGGMIALKHILVATDFGEPAHVALQYALELARRFDAQLHVLHVVDDLGAHAYSTIPVSEDLGALQMELERTARARLAAILPERDRTAARARLEVVVSASPAQAILSCARDSQIDLIIIGTHGRHGLARVFLGSVARHVSGAAPCPVLTVRAHERDFVKPDLPEIPASARRDEGVESPALSGNSRSHAGRH